MLTPEQIATVQMILAAKPVAARCAAFGAWSKSNPEICKQVNVDAKAAGKTAQGATSTYFSSSVWDDAGFAEKRAAAEAKYITDKLAYRKLMNLPDKKRKRSSDDDGDDSGHDPKAAKLKLAATDLELVTINDCAYVRDSVGHLRKLIGVVYADQAAVLAAATKSKAAADKAKAVKNAAASVSEDSAASEEEEAAPEGEAKAAASAQ